MRTPSFISLVVLSLGVSLYAMVVYGFLPLGVLVHPDMRAAYLANPIGIGVLFGGVAGLYVSLHAYGGAVAQLGFGCLAIAWLCWVPNLLVAEVLFNRVQSPSLP